MSEESDSIYATIEVVGSPDPLEQSTHGKAGEFRMDVLLIGVVVVGAIILSNIWLGMRSERADSE